MNIFSGSILNYLSLLLFALIAAGLSYYLYNKANIPKFTKAALITLRTVSLFLILMLLLNPFIDYFKEYILESPNIVLIDRSRSMEITDKNGLTDKAEKDLRNFNNMVFYNWGSGLIQGNGNNDSGISKYSDYSTNLALALENIQNLNLERINSVTVLSDGLINEGNNITQAAKNLNVPINFLLTGDTVQKKDVVLKNVLYNKKQFINSSSKVFAEIETHDFAGEIKVNLFENNRKIKTNPVMISGGSSKFETTFELYSPAEGMNKYKIEIEPVEGEITTINNNGIFYIKFIDNKIKLLLVSGNPSYDLSALKQTLNRSENIKYETRVQKNSTEFYEGELPEFREYDAVLLQGIPNNHTNTGTVDYIRNQIKKHKTALIFFNSADISITKLNALNDVLPFGINDSQQREARGLMTLIISELAAGSENLRRLNNLPQSYFMQGAFSSKPNSTILGLFNSEPAIITDNSGEIKSAAFLGYGFHEWNLSPGGSYEYLQNLTSGFISSCVDENSKDIFTVKTDKSSYATGEPVIVSASLKENSINGKAIVTISGNGNTSVFELSKESENTFKSELKFFEKGDYTIKAELYENNSVKYNGLTKFTIDDPFMEYRETKATDETLKQIALNTGGTVISGNGISANEEIFKSKHQSNEGYTFKSLFRKSVWYLIFILVLLSIEWYLRKRNNLA